MRVYAVIDTNVIVLGIMSRNPASATVQVIGQIGRSSLVPVYNDEIMSEYVNVLHRIKFGFPERLVTDIVNRIKRYGIKRERVSSGETFLDASDAVFYEVALSKEDAYLVTGNQKHFPVSPIVVTPAEMIEILKR